MSNVVRCFRGAISIASCDISFSHFGKIRPGRVLCPWGVWSPIILFARITRLVSIRKTSICINISVGFCRSYLLRVRLALMRMKQLHFGSVAGPG